MPLRSTLKKAISRYWLIFFFLLVAGLLAVFKISIKDFIATLKMLTPWQVTAVVAVFLSISVMQVFLRKYLLGGFGYQCRSKHLYMIHFSTMAAHYSTPVKLGFPLAVYLINKTESVPYSVGTAVILIELMANLSLCGIITVVGSLIYLKPAALSILTAAGIFLALAVFLKTIVVKGVDTLPFLVKLHAYAADVKKAFANLSLKTIMCYFGFLLVIRATAATNLLLITVFVQADISFVQALFSGSAAYFIGALSMIPMGLGTRDLSMFYFLHHFGMSGQAGMVVISIQRVLFTGISLLLGLCFGSVMGVLNGQSNKKQSSGQFD